jgi:hypothetical protein
VSVDPIQLATRKPELLTNRITERFFHRFLMEDRPIVNLSIVSPWISEWETGAVGLASVGEAIAARNTRTVILTRPPLEAWHRSALDLLRGYRGVGIYLLPDLHAKLFVCEAIPVGSANLTARALSNFEVGVLFEGRGVLSPLIKELRVLVQDLRRRSIRYEGETGRG